MDYSLAIAIVIVVLPIGTVLQLVHRYQQIASVFRFTRIKVGARARSFIFMRASFLVIKVTMATSSHLVVDMRHILDSKGE